MITKDFIEIEDLYSAHNYHPLDIVIHKAQGVWVWDIEGRKFLDCLSSYSAVNQGHLHPRIVEAAINQLQQVSLTSRAFRNDKLPLLAKKIAEFTGKEKVLLMNSGAEAVETALKAARKWAYQVKNVPLNKAEIIACSDNFHGRTITIISFSTEKQYQDGFGPLTPGFKIVKYGDIADLKSAITPNTCAFIIEPIQGEAGIHIPPEGYLKQAQEICQENNVLFIADEIQTGFGRCGKFFACDHEEVIPDIYVMGKAMSGGLYPVSAIACNDDIMQVFKPGDHGSTFGGNPLGCSIALAALEVIEDEQLPKRSQQLGEYFINQLREIDSPVIKEIRGRGLMIGIELNTAARPYCEKFKTAGILCKETHLNVVRFAPPLIIQQAEIDMIIAAAREIFA